MFHYILLPIIKNQSSNGSWGGTFAGGVGLMEFSADICLNIQPCLTREHFRNEHYLGAL